MKRVVRIDSGLFRQLRESLLSSTSSLEDSYMSVDEGYEPSPRTVDVEECLIAIQKNAPEYLRKTLNGTKIHPDTVYGWLKLSLFQAYLELIDSIRIKRDLSPGSLDATNADKILSILLAQVTILEKKK